MENAHMCRSTLHLWTSKCLTEVVILISKMRKQRCWERKWLSRSVTKQGKSPLSLYYRQRWGSKEQTCPHLIRTAESQVQWRHSDTAGRTQIMPRAIKPAKPGFFQFCVYSSSPGLSALGLWCHNNGVPLVFLSPRALGESGFSAFLSIFPELRGTWEFLSLPVVCDQWSSGAPKNTPLHVHTGIAVGGCLILWKYSITQHFNAADLWLWTFSIL